MVGKRIAVVTLLVSLAGCPKPPPDPIAASWPLTINEAVSRLKSKLTSSDLAFVADTPRAKLSQFSDTLGVDIRNDYGLWAGNKELLHDCESSDPDACSAEIIQALWVSLQTGIPQ